MQTRQEIRHSSKVEQTGQMMRLMKPGSMQRTLMMSGAMIVAKSLLTLQHSL